MNGYFAFKHPMALLSLRTMNFAQLLLPDFALILAGYCICRFTKLDRTIWSQVDALVYYLLFPVLLFYSIVRSPIDLGTTSHLLGAGLALGTCSVALSYSLIHLPLLKRYIPARAHAASAQVGFRFNSFVALALVDRISGPQGSLLIAVLIGTCVPLFNVAAVWPMARQGQHGFVRELVSNPLIVGTVSGLVFNLLGLRIPEWMAPTVMRVGTASLTLGLMAAGAGMQFKALTQHKMLGLSVLSIRHFLGPLCALLMAYWFGLSGVQATVLMSFAALPTASTCYLLASRMGYDGAYVAGLVTLSTLLGMASLTFSLGILRPLLPA